MTVEFALRIFGRFLPPEETSLYVEWVFPSAPGSPVRRTIQDVLECVHGVERAWAERYSARVEWSAHVTTLQEITAAIAVALESDQRLRAVLCTTLGLAEVTIRTTVEPPFL